jgi:hypothetical protein
MKKFIWIWLVLLTFGSLLLGSKAHAQTGYNAIATAYVTTTISQNVVFNDAMRQGGTFTFSVLAHNGGGRAGQSDTANVRIQFYNSSGGLMGTFQSSYNANLPNPNAVCGNPCIDPAVPWSTLTVSTTVDAASASGIAYAKISMYGIDGSYWAGDYGPWYRAPTFTFNGGANLAYNPEFGPYNNITAQGWTSSPGFGACQGAWGGSNACIVNSNGVPGTSTVGLVANQNGGGPSATGGTTSGQPGGYNSTMSTTNATGGPPPPNPTNIYTTSTTTVRITNIWPTSNNSPSGEGASNAFDNNPNTKYLNFDKYNAGVTVKLSEGRVVSGFTITTANDFPGRDPTSYKLYGSNDGKTWVLINQGTLTLSDNRYTVSDVVSVNNTAAYFYYYMQFPTTKAGDGCGLDCNSMQIAEITYIYDTNNTTRSTDQTLTGSSAPVDPVQAASAPQYPSYVTTNGTSSLTVNDTVGSSTITNTQNNRVTLRTNATLNNQGIWIEQTGSNNSVTIDQAGRSAVKGIGQDKAVIQGNSNTITINQGVTGLGQNVIEMGVVGDSNTLNINQARTTTGLNSGANGHYQLVDVSGYTNTLTTQQSNTGGVGTHYMETTIVGNNNSVTAKQTDNGNKIMFTTINGSSNTADIVQKGTGQHYLDLTMNGPGNTATILQEGIAGHKATIDMTRGTGGPNTLDLSQTGSNPLSIGIQQTCNVASCGAVVVRQTQ